MTKTFILTEVGKEKHGVEKVTTREPVEYVEGGLSVTNIDGRVFILSENDYEEDEDDTVSFYSNG